MILVQKSTNVRPYHLQFFLKKKSVVIQDICLLHDTTPSHYELFHSFTLFYGRQWKRVKIVLHSNFLVLFRIPFCVSRRTIGVYKTQESKVTWQTNKSVFFMTWWCNVYHSWFFGELGNKMVTNQSKENKQVHLFHSKAERERERKRRHFWKTKEVTASVQQLELSLFTLFSQY